MEGSVAADQFGAPDSWELADLDESMTRLMVSSSSKKKNSTLSSSSSSSGLRIDESTEAQALTSTGSSSTETNGGVVVSDDSINQVDQFLRDALQNPRERLSILRMEQEVEKFIRDSTQQHLEFQQLPTSYLRLAAHRVAQHYCLQSMVVLDNNQPDGSGSRIIVHKASGFRYPSIRLADIPVSVTQEESNSAVKVAIKQRPQKRSQNSGNSNSSKSNHAKTVEERKEEYNRARARIFNSNSTSVAGALPGGKPEIEPVMPDTFQHCPVGPRRMEEKPVVELPVVSSGRGLRDSSADSSRSSGRGRVEKELVGRYRTNSRVAIFRDRDVDCKDPDYDRSYDRYMQRFDPGFGFSGGPHTMQPLYSPVINYNTEFPQLGAVHRPQISAEHQARPIPQHLHGSWTGASTPPGVGFETMIGPFNPNHVGAQSTSAIYMHSSHYPCPPRPGMQFVNPHEHGHQPFAQPHQQLPEASYGLARPQ
ncbi:hypothetical protein MKX01_027163 [Papaver californicum]|nr:hypothetical protein MKX01_027163 [Papaver californicum]